LKYYFKDVASGDLPFLACKIAVVDYAPYPGILALGTFVTLNTISKIKIVFKVIISYN